MDTRAVHRAGWDNSDVVTRMGYEGCAPRRRPAGGLGRARISGLRAGRRWVERHRTMNRYGYERQSKTCKMFISGTRAGYDGLSGIRRPRRAQRLRARPANAGPRRARSRRRSRLRALARFRRRAALAKAPPAGASSADARRTRPMPARRHQQSDASLLSASAAAARRCCCSRRPRAPRPRRVLGPRRPRPPVSPLLIIYDN